MFEIKPYEQILEECLARVPETLDKRQGSIIQSAIAPCCVELALLWIRLYGVSQEVFIVTATGEFLDALVEQNGVTRLPATHAIRLGLFNREIPIGSRFSFADTTYEVIELYEPIVVGEDIKYRMRCEQAGSIGNQYFGSMIPITQLTNLTKAELADILLVGDDVETDEDLKERYKEEIVSPSFGGNVAYYKEVTTNLEGVLGCKVIPIWNGGGTVKLIITGYDGVTPPSLVSYVQQQIDPQQDQLGMGLAPIGHLVTVEGVETVSFRITITVVKSAEADESVIQTGGETAIRKYFGELTEEWADTQSLIIRSAQILTRVLNVAGVLDVSDVVLSPNGQTVTTENVELEPNQIPALYELHINWGS